jgi:hypothetical protein
MGDSHLMLSAMENYAKIRRNDPERAALTRLYDPGIFRHLVAVAQKGGLRARGHNKRNRP